MLISDRLGGENVMLNLMLIYNIYKDALAHYVSYFFSIILEMISRVCYNKMLASMRMFVCI